MFQYRKFDKHILDSLSEDNQINLKLNKSYIAYEEQEILKAEIKLLAFQNCLLQQNNALNNFIIEEERLENELINFTERFGYNQIKCENNIHTTSPERIVIKRKEEESVVIEEEDKKYPQLRTLQIPSLENKRIYTMLVKASTDYIIVGGSKGLLLRHSETGTHIYKTRIKEDIIRLETIKEHSLLSLIVFTKENILIFKDIMDKEVSKQLSLPRMRHVFNCGNTVFITLRDGSIKKLHNGIILNHPQTHSSKNEIVFPSTLHSNCTYISLEDSKLYWTTKKHLSELKLVKGVSNAKMVVLIRLGVYLCYSDKRIWTLNAEGKIIDTLRCKNEIRFVERSASYLVVADYSNNVRMYVFPASGEIGDKICEQSVEGTITALAVVKKKVYVAVGDVIFLINY